ncbi:MAG: leucine-rich repeat domain-containing protein [Clostridia bacterium]|nr:leucine-rich repeat domain-containing protein [Clostridia bacterium]
MRNRDITKNITTLNIDNDNFKIVDRVLLNFRDYQSQKIAIPKGVTELAQYSVSCMCANVIHIPMSVDIIRRHAFLLSRNVTKLYIENPDIYLEVGSLENIHNLKEVYIGGQRVETVVTQRSDKKNSLYLEKYVGQAKEYRVDDDISVIGSEAFLNCETLERVEIPKSVGHIGTKAFSGCTSLKEIEMHDSIQDISLWAFENCKSVKEFTLPENIDEWDISSEIFKGWTSRQTIRAPKHLKKFKFLQKWRKGCRAKIIYF